MSADNELVILKDEATGEYTIHMVFISGLENFGWYEEQGIELPCEEFPYATPEDMARDGREWGRFKSFHDAYDAAHKVANDEMVEYGVSVWCEHDDPCANCATLTAEVERLKERVNEIIGEARDTDLDYSEAYNFLKRLRCQALEEM